LLLSVPLDCMGTDVFADLGGLAVGAVLLEGAREIPIWRRRPSSARPVKRTPRPSVRTSAAVSRAAEACAEPTATAVIPARTRT
jgi:hypothetical protein